MEERSRILVVDDERLHLNVIVELLNNDYAVIVSKSGEKALEIARLDPLPELILLDILMPGMDGYQVCKKLKEDPLTRDIPVIFLTVKRDVSDEAYGFGLGAVDYITKPFSPPIVRARVATHLRLKSALDDLGRYNERLEAEVIQRSEQIRLADEHTKQLQVQLQQAQKMETLGQLTGGIAHDFNNILAVVIGYTGLAQGMDLADDPKLAGYLDQVMAAGEKARGLVEQLLAFSRGVPSEGELLNVGEVVESALTLLRPIIPASIELEANFDDSLPPVLLDKVQLYQLVMNLCINARDVMEEGGTIAITTTKFTGQKNRCTACGEPVHDHAIELTVSDEGSGIPPENIDVIFKSLFSTKPVGEGTGMGLAVVDEIVHQRGGHILVERNRVVGTSFRLLFPFPESSSESGSDSTEVSQAGHALVVVHDKSPALLFREHLEHNGWTVTLEDRLERVEALLQQRANDYQLLIADHAPPELDGMALLSAVGEPLLLAKSILCVDANAKTLEGVTVLRKPFGSRELMAAVAATVGSVADQ